MPKLSLADVSNITGQETSAINTLNNNFEAIEEAFDNTLSRDGTSPNTMLVDLDMNSKDVINVGTLVADYITVGGETLTSELFAQGPQGEQGPQGPAGTTSPPASTTVEGILEIATLSEALAGTPTNLAIVSDVMKQIVDLICPVGSVQGFLRNSPPSGWLELNGLTIGSASSGATARANADTETLFTLLWQQTSAVDLPIYTSTGVLSSKGASASADFAANKRLALPNTRGEFLRGWDNGRGVDIGRTIASSQIEAIGPHTHTASTDSQGAHSHTFSISRTNRRGLNGNVNVPDWSSGDTATGSSTYNGSTASTGAHTHTITVNNNSGTENRPRNVSVMYCVKY